MRIYHGGPSPAALRKCRESAPSHVHGACWTPSKMTPHDWPYFVDNGAYTSSFDPDEWLALLDEIDKMPHPPDFVVLPDVYNDAEGTVQRHREWVSEVFVRNLRPAYVFQPGMTVHQQTALADALGADTIFLGGEMTWKRSFGPDIVREAHSRDLRVHIGNPGGGDGLVWAARMGFDSADTSSIVQNQNWHWLERLEGLKEGSLKKDGRQSQLTEVARGV